VPDRPGTSPRLVAPAPAAGPTPSCSMGPCCVTRGSADADLVIGPGVAAFGTHARPAKNPASPATTATAIRTRTPPLVKIVLKTRNLTRASRANHANFYALIGSNPLGHFNPRGRLFVKAREKDQGKGTVYAWPSVFAMASGRKLQDACENTPTQKKRGCRIQPAASCELLVTEKELVSLFRRRRRFILLGRFVHLRSCSR